MNSDPGSRNFSLRRLMRLGLQELRGLGRIENRPCRIPTWDLVSRNTKQFSLTQTRYLSPQPALPSHDHVLTTFEEDVGIPVLPSPRHPGSTSNLGRCTASSSFPPRSIFELLGRSSTASRCCCELRKHLVRGPGSLCFRDDARHKTTNQTRPVF